MGKSVNQVKNFYKAGFVKSNVFSIEAGTLVQLPALPYYAAPSLFKKIHGNGTRNSSGDIKEQRRVVAGIVLLTVIPILPVLTIAFFAIALLAALLLTVSAPITFGVAAVVDALRK